jgi:hypothetical protein
MAARLGIVLYWIGCIGAALIAIFVVASLVLDPRPDNWSMATSDLGRGALLWIIGLALRFVLAGRNRNSTIGR